MTPTPPSPQDPQAVATLDITRDLCPMTFVKTKLELEDLAVNDILEVFLRQGEPLENVTRSVAEEGHEVVLEEETERHDIWRLLIRRGEAP